LHDRLLRLRHQHSPLSSGSTGRLQDSVKWRGPLFHRFTRALVDDSAAVRALAEFLLADTLATKARPAFFHGATRLHGELAGGA